MQNALVHDALDLHVGDVAQLNVIDPGAVNRNRSGELGGNGATHNAHWRLLQVAACRVTDGLAVSPACSHPMATG